MAAGGSSWGRHTHFTTFSFGGSDGKGTMAQAGRQAVERRSRGGVGNLRWSKLTWGVRADQVERRSL